MAAYRQDSRDVCISEVNGEEKPLELDNLRKRIRCSFHASNTPASCGKMSYPRCWCTSTERASDSWLQVDLESPHFVTAISTQGNPFGNGDYTKKYKLQYSDDGVTWTTYEENGKQIFDANVDNGSVKTNHFKKVILSRFIRICPVEWYCWPFLRIEVYGVPLKEANGLQGKPLGVAMEPGVIPNKSITCSSHAWRTPASCARLNYPGCWCAGEPLVDSWLQVDLENLHLVAAISTQGNPYGNCDYTKKYKLQHSGDGKTWTMYEENGNQIFDANVDNTTVKTNVIQNNTVARFIRICPVEWYCWPSLRAEVYGIPFKEELCFDGLQGKPLGLAMEPGVIPNKNITCSSHAWRTPASCARLNYPGCWCAGEPLGDSWLQVDLENLHFVTAISTQGNPFGNCDYTKKYKLQHSQDGKTWTMYEENGNQIFDANIDNNTIKTNDLQKVIVTRFIRICPVEWYCWPCLRVEVYGVPLQKVTEGLIGEPLGLESGNMQNTRITYSSYEKILPLVPRLNYPGCWRTGELPDSWLQVDLEDLHFVTAISTQGNSHGNGDYTKKYKLQYSEDGESWETKVENGEQTLDIDVNSNTDKTVEAQESTLARFIRIYPVERYWWPSLRIEVYEVPFQKVTVGQKGKKPIGVESRETPNKNITSSSRKDFESWLPVDHEDPYFVISISTEENPFGNGDYTKKYKIQYSDDGVSWAIHDENGQQIFDPIVDSTSVRTNNISKIAQGKFIRICPEDCYSLPPLRVDVYDVPRKEYSFEEKLNDNKGSLPSWIDKETPLQLYTPINAIGDEDIDKLVEWEKAGTKGWKRTKKSREYEIWTRKAYEGGPLITKAIITFHGIPYDDAVDIIRDWDTRQDWDKTFDKVTVLETIDTSKLVYCPVKKRELFLAVQDRQDTKEEYYASAWKNTAHPKIDNNKNKLLKLYYLVSGLVICPIDGGSQITLLSQVKGSVPSQVKSTFLAANPAKWIDALKKHHANKTKENGTKEE